MEYPISQINASVQPTLHITTETNILNRLRDGLNNSKNIQELLKFLAEFNLTDNECNQVCNSDAGKQIIFAKLAHLRVTNDEIDQCVANCFKNKNLFILEILLSLPEADIQLLVSQNNTFRASLFDKTKHGVNLHSSIITKRLSPLLHLAIQEWPEAVPLLLTSGADIHCQDYYPARAEKYYGNSPVTNYYEFSSGGMTPLHVACILNQVTVITALIEQGANPNFADEYGRTPLHMAALYNHPEAINLLVNHGANIECSFETIYVNKIGFDAETKNSPLILSMACGNSKAVIALLDNNCSLEYDKPSLLRQAVITRQISVIKKLNEIEPGLLVKNKEIIFEALAKPRDINTVLNELKHSSGFNGLLDTYPHHHRDYLAATDNSEFIPQLKELMEG